MLRIIPVLLMVAVCGGANAQELYKCTVNGKVTYSVAACKEGTMKAIPVPPAPKPDPNRGDALKREQAALAALQQARAEREAKEQRAEQQSSTAARTERCAKLRAEKQVADENASRGPGFNRANLRNKADQIGEVLAAECGA